MENNNYQNVNEDLSCCVVWTPIPMLTWLCPAIGHVGVTDSQGITYDFEGDYRIGKGKLIFGDPRQKWKLNVDPKKWDEAVETVTQRFGSIHYNIITSNCHYYAAACLQEAGIPQIKPFFGSWVNGATIQIIWGLILKARSLSFSDVIAIWLPFIIILLAAFFIFGK